MAYSYYGRSGGNQAGRLLAIKYAPDDSERSREHVIEKNMSVISMVKIVILLFISAKLSGMHASGAALPAEPPVFHGWSRLPHHSPASGF